MRAAHLHLYLVRKAFLSTQDDKKTHLLKSLNLSMLQGAEVAHQGAVVAHQGAVVAH
jgi:hypothetical protein